MTPFIICDIGSNHRGSLDNALKAVEVAKERGADAVKFQMFTAMELYGLDIEMPFAMPPDWLPKLAEAASVCGVEFMCSAFSPTGVGVVDPFVRHHKLASSEFCHVGIIDAMIATGKPIIASTGGHGIGDCIEAWKYINKPNRLTILECVALYPSPAEHYDLNVIRKWAEMVGLGFQAVGISDHTMGSAVAVAAVGAGATVWEKHLDPTPGSPTPDSPVSLGPAEFAMYVQEIREAASAMGDGIKQPRHQHQAQLQWKRRLIATQSLKVGDTLRYNENYGIYRSLKDDTNGLPPWAYEQVNGRTMTKAVEPGDSIGPRDTQ